jgi:Cysteine rich repeat
LAQWHRREQLTMKHSILQFATMGLLVAAGLAQADGSISKCKDAKGGVVYVDKPCEVYGLQFVEPLKQGGVTLLPSSLPADEGGAPGKGGVSACMADTSKFCGGSRGSGGKTMDCLLDHQNDISDACYDALKARMESQHSAQGCKQEMQKFCAGIQSGGGRIMDCLLDHQQDISDGCYDTLKSQHAGQK